MTCNHHATAQVWVSPTASFYGSMPRVLRDEAAVKEGPSADFWREAEADKTRFAFPASNGSRRWRLSHLKAANFLLTIDTIKIRVFSPLNRNLRLRFWPNPVTSRVGVHLDSGQQCSSTRDIHKTGGHVKSITWDKKIHRGCTYSASPNCVRLLSTQELTCRPPVFIIALPLLSCSSTHNLPIKAVFDFSRVRFQDFFISSFAKSKIKTIEKYGATLHASLAIISLLFCNEIDRLFTQMNSHFFS